MGTRGTIGRTSTIPGVVTPGASSIVWYQSWLDATRSARSAGGLGWATVIGVGTVAKHLSRPGPSDILWRFMVRLKRSAREEPVTVPAPAPSERTAPEGARNLVFVVLDSLRYDSWLAAE